MKLADRPTPRTDAIALRHEGSISVNQANAQFNDLLDKSRSLEQQLAHAVEALEFVDGKIGHFAKAPQDDELAVVSLIGELARRTKQAIAEIAAAQEGRVNG